MGKLVLIGIIILLGVISGYGFTKPGSSIVILNPQSYPFVGGTWTVKFKTDGIEDLEIIGNYGKEIEFLGLFCGNQSRTVIKDGNRVVAKNWFCSDIGYVVVRVLKGGKHFQLFRFGNNIAHASNLAVDCDLSIVQSTDQVNITCSNTFRMVFDKRLNYGGGGLDHFYVLSEANSAQTRAGEPDWYNFFSLNVNNGTWHSETDAYQQGEIEILENSSLRIRLRQKTNITASTRLERLWTIYSGPKVFMKDTFRVDSTQDLRCAIGVHATNNTFYSAGISDSTNKVWVVTDNSATYSDVVAAPFSNALCEDIGASITWEQAAEYPDTYYARVRGATLASTPANDYAHYYMMYVINGLTSTGDEWEPYVKEYRYSDPLTINVGSKKFANSSVLVMHFDGDVKDESGNGNDGTVNGATYTSNGRFGGAYDFDGADDYIEVPYDTSLDINGDITLMAWFKWRGDSANQIIMFRNDDADHINYQLYVDADNKVWLWMEDEADADYWVSSVSTVNDNEWHFAAATWDGTEMKIYIDSVLENTTTASFTPSSGAAPFQIGVRYYGGSYNSYFNGTIDEVVIYNRALTAEEILESYQNGPPHDPGDVDNDGFNEAEGVYVLKADDNEVNFTIHDETKPDSSTVGLWHLNGNANDDSGNNNDGAVYGATYTSNGRFGGAYDFDGADDYIEILDDPTLNPVHITVAAWIKPRNPNEGQQTIIDKREWGSGGGGYTLRLDINEVTFILLNSTGNEFRLHYATSLTPDWHYIVGTWDGTNQKLYLDGIEVNSTTPAIDDISGSSNKLRIGDVSPLAVPSEYNFNGTIDEVVIYNRSLGAEEIKLHYARGLERYYPVFKITNYTSSNEPEVIKNGTKLTKNTDYKIYLNTTTDTVIVQYLDTITSVSEFVIRVPLVQCSTDADCGSGFECLNNYCFSTSGRFVIQNLTGTNLTIIDDYGQMAIRGALASNWWNYSWTYKKLVNITENSGNNLTDYQVQVNITELVYNNTGLVASYHFDNNAKDSSGNNNDGAVYGATYTSNGRFGGAYDFDGADDWISVDNILNPNTTPFTISVWAKLSEPWGDFRRTIFSNAQDLGPIIRGDNRTEWGKGRAIFNWRSGGTWYALQSEPLSQDVWYHFVGTFNGTTGGWKFYVNGVEQTSSPSGSGTVANSGAPDATSRDYGIGTDRAFPDNFFNGTIDEVRIYDRALTAEEIQELYSAEKLRLDYGDIRFTWVNQSSGEQEKISYWMENDKYVWIKVPFIQANDNAEVYVYYGNPNATSESNGTATFDAFDDFEEYALGSLDGQDDWISPSSTNNPVTVDTTNPFSGSKSAKTHATSSDANKTLNLGDYHLLDVRAYLDNVGGTTTQDFAFSVRGSNGPWARFHSRGECSTVNWCGGYSSNTLDTGVPKQEDVWVRWRFGIFGGLADYWIDDTLVWNDVSTYVNDIYKFISYNDEGANGYFDLIIVRKYRPPEPTSVLDDEQHCSYTGSDEWSIKNPTGDVIAFINSTGSLCMRGSLYTLQSSIVPDGNDLVIANQTGDYVAMFDGATGSLYLMKNIVENANEI